MTDDAPSLNELARTLLDFRAEYRADRAAYVRLDLYRAEREAVLARLATVETEVKRGIDEKISEWAQVRNSTRASAVGAVFAVIVAVIGIVIK